MKITDAQRNALNWLHERGGSGYLDQYGARHLSTGAGNAQ